VNNLPKVVSITKRTQTHNLLSNESDTLTITIPGLVTLAPVVNSIQDKCVPVECRGVVVVVAEARAQALVLYDRLQVLRGTRTGSHLVQRAARHRP